jgi:hypothetical protein
VPADCLTGDREVGNVPLKDGAEEEVKSGNRPIVSAEDRDNGVIPVDPLAVDPLAVDPLAVDPLAVDPLPVDPTTVAPVVLLLVVGVGRGEESGERQDAEMVEGDRTGAEVAVPANPLNPLYSLPLCLSLLTPIL